MQIDVISENTLKLTLSKPDMFDFGIQYESLSSENPETRRLLADLLKRLSIEKSFTSFNFTGERLFVEAYPRPDGGCMLYVSGMTNTSDNERLMIKGSKFPQYKTDVTNIKPEHAERTEWSVVCETDNLPLLGKLCKSLLILQKPNLRSAIYSNGEIYRLLLDIYPNKSVIKLAKEYGRIYRNNLAQKEVYFTFEYFRLLSCDIKTIAGLY